jgi:transcriptional regulator with XRE-family HTH domain
MSRRRAAVKMSVREVAERAKVSPNTVTRIEAGMPVNHSTMEAVRRAFEAAGVEFTDGRSAGRAAEQTEREWRIGR